MKKQVAKTIYRVITSCIMVAYIILSIIPPICSECVIVTTSGWIVALASFILAAIEEDLAIDLTHKNNVLVLENTCLKRRIKDLESESQKQIHENPND